LLIAAPCRPDNGPGAESWQKSAAEIRPHSFGVDLGFECDHQLIELRRLRLVELIVGPTDVHLPSSSRHVTASSGSAAERGTMQEVIPDAHVV
jgi:hypothetical protein